MNKRIIVSVSCANEMASEVPELFTVVIDSEQHKRIQQLSEAVKSLNVYAIEEFDYSGTWSESCFDPSDIEEDSSNLDSVIQSLEQDNARVEIPMLRVVDDGFFFTAVPKHYNDDMALLTRKIYLSELDNCEPLVMI